MSDPVFGVDYYGFVYLWFDTLNRKFIIGSHHGSVSDGYTTSTGGLHVRNIFRKRPSTMKRKILAYNNIDCPVKTRGLEQRFLDLRPSIATNERYYNLSQSAAGGWEYVNSNPSKINPMSDPYFREKHRERLKFLVSKDPFYFGDKRGDKNPMRDPSVLNSHPSLFTTDNNPMNDPSIRVKVRELIVRKYGRKVMVDGVEYDSLRGAAKELGFSPQKLRYRINSVNFKNYYFKDREVLNV
jgi:hypothetical protein